MSIASDVIAVATQARMGLDAEPPPEDLTPMERAVLRRFDRIDDRLDRIVDRLDDLGESLGRVEIQTAEIPVMNENIQALRDHAGI